MEERVGRRAGRGRLYFRTIVYVPSTEVREESERRKMACGRSNRLPTESSLFFLLLCLSPCFCVCLAVPVCLCCASRPLNISILLFPHSILSLRQPPSPARPYSSRRLSSLSSY